MANQVWQSFRIEVTTMEPLHIGGTSHILSDVHNPIVLLNEDVPAIPGTSLKGAWRSKIERYLIGYLENNGRLSKGEELGIKPCIPASAQTLSEDEKQFAQNEGKYKRRRFFNKEARSFENRYTTELDPCDYDRDSDYICPACYLLGAQTLHGFIRVPFLTPVKGQKEVDVLLYSIREDRAKGGAARGTNRGWYVVNPGIKFEGEVEILLEDKLRGWRFGEERGKLKYKGLDRWLKDKQWTVEKIKKELIAQCLESINILGGYKSRGCGKVQIRVSL
jgi:CRISPR/Cas system CSM-associated protein Csm3 (group 7 of RAMP superfamily)